MKELSEICTGTNACGSEKTAGLKIAVFGNETDVPSSMFMADRILIYEKRGGIWTPRHTKKMPRMDFGSPASVRASVLRIVSLLGDTAVIAGSSISGIAFFEFDKQGKQVFEIFEASDEQLCGIAEDVAVVEAKRKLDAAAFKKAAPAETETPGVYFVDVISISEQFPDLSSKMILKPFLKNTPFTKLIIICRHVPVWLESESDYHIMQEREGDHLIVTVTLAFVEQEEGI